MRLEELVSLGMSEKTAEKVLNFYREALRGFIPKSRFDEVNEARKQAENNLKEQGKQLRDLADQVKCNEELIRQIEYLQKSNKEGFEKYAAHMRALQTDAAVRLTLSGCVHDLDMVLGLLDRGKIELDDKGNVKSGLDEQLKILKESKSFLFLQKESKPVLKGIKPVEGKDSNGNSVSL